MKRLLMISAATAMMVMPAAGAQKNMQPDPIYVQTATPGPGETAFDFSLKGYVFGIRMIKARYKGEYDESSYRIFTDLKTSGLGALLKKLRIWSHTDGRYDKTGIYPVSHTQQNLDKKSRRVEMRYDYDTKAVSVDINPRIGSQGVPPATPEERFSADDVPSAILNMMMRGQNLTGNVCDGTVRVFDSKQHYGLRMVKAGTRRVKFLGSKNETLWCKVYYEPISGFDPEDLPSPEEANTPVDVYMIKDEATGLHIPVRFTYKISGFTAVIKMDEMRVQAGPS